jgi:hypothetical protein
VSPVVTYAVCLVASGAAVGVAMRISYLHGVAAGVRKGAAASAWFNRAKALETAPAEITRMQCRKCWNDCAACSCAKERG